MSEHALSIEALGVLFPFLLVVDEQLIITHAGPSLQDRYPCIGEPVMTKFRIVRPRLTWDWDALCGALERLVVLGCGDSFNLHVTPVMLAGPTPLLALCGSPWIEKAEDVQRHGLTIKNFAPHDHIVSYLFLLQRLEAEARRRQEDLKRDAIVQAEIQRLKLIQQERQRLDLLKDQFLANVSHELRTPLTGILGAAEGIEEGTFGDIPEDLRYPVDVIINSADHLLGLVNDLLELSKYTAEDFNVAPTKQSLPAIVKEMIATQAHKLTQKSLSLEVDLPDELFASCDLGATKQILLNLLGNAIKYTSTGYIRISLEQRGDMATLIIRDSGCGIPEHNLDQIFEPFRRADSLNNRAKDGAGLGLAISRRLAHRHGGDITVESTLGQGSAFTLTLPLHKP